MDNTFEETELIVNNLRDIESARSYEISRQLTQLRATKAVIQSDACGVDLVGYAFEGECEMHQSDVLFAELIASWDSEERRVGYSLGSGAFVIKWRGHHLELVRIGWAVAHGEKQTHWTIADNKEIAEEFLGALTDWSTEIRGEILVFQAGYWMKSKELFESVQNATFDNLILPEQIKQEIQRDFQHFFNSRDEYTRYGVPWKRGVLFYGSPGNGKTHTLKALINWLKQPCLYVKSLDAGPYESEHAMIARVFARARQTTPCLLVLEDLDSMIKDTNRSYFLNELDGFAANTGIVVVATTNHPERLDPAIVERPSRFDRKYEFALPSPDERMAYLSMWNERSDSALRLSKAGIEAITAQTEEFSFAYLKELWLSSMMAWMENRESESMDKIMTTHVDSLRTQMANPEPEPTSDAKDGTDPMIAAMMRFRRRRG